MSGGSVGSEFLTSARKAASAAGYDPDALGLARDGKHKLEYKTPEGRIVKFGSKSNKDFIQYTDMERQGKIPKGKAAEHRRRYLARATKIKGDWKSDKYSPNNLAINILW